MVLHLAFVIDHGMATPRVSQGNLPSISALSIRVLGNKLHTKFLKKSVWEMFSQCPEIDRARPVLKLTKTLLYSTLWSWSLFMNLPEPYFLWMDQAPPHISCLNSNKKSRIFFSVDVFPFWHFLLNSLIGQYVENCSDTLYPKKGEECVCGGWYLGICVDRGVGNIHVTTHPGVSKHWRAG